MAAKPGITISACEKSDKKPPMYIQRCPLSTEDGFFSRLPPAQPWLMVNATANKESNLPEWPIQGPILWNLHNLRKVGLMYSPVQVFNPPFQ